MTWTLPLRRLFGVDSTFKTIIPIDGAIDGATKGVREKLKLILKAIASDEGKRIPFYKDAAKLDDSDCSVFFQC